MAIVNTITLSALLVGLMLINTELRYDPFLVIMSIATLIIFMDVKITVDIENASLFACGILVLVLGSVVRGSLSDWLYIAGMVWSFLLYEKLARREVNARLLMALLTLQFVSLFLAQNYMYDRFTSFLYHPNSVGQVAIMLLCVALVLGRNKYFIAMFSCLTLFIATISASRQTFLFLAMYLVSWLFFRYKKGFGLLLLLVVFTVLYGGLYILDDNNRPGLFQLLIQVTETITTTDGRSVLDANGRDVLAQEAVAYATDNFWGKGYDPREYEYLSTHNMFLDILYRGGWLFLVWYVVFLLRLIAKSPSPRVKAGLVAVNVMLCFDNAVPFGWSPGSAMTVLPYYLGSMVMAGSVAGQEINRTKSEVYNAEGKDYAPDKCADFLRTGESCIGYCHKIGQ